MHKRSHYCHRVPSVCPDCEPELVCPSHPKKVDNTTSTPAPAASITSLSSTSTSVPTSTSSSVDEVGTHLQQCMEPPCNCVSSSCCNGFGCGYGYGNWWRNLVNPKAAEATHATSVIAKRSDNDTPVPTSTKSGQDKSYSHYNDHLPASTIPLSVATGSITGAPSSVPTTFSTTTSSSTVDLALLRALADLRPMYPPTCQHPWECECPGKYCNSREFVAE